MLIYGVRKGPERKETNRKNEKRETVSFFWKAKKADNDNENDNDNDNVKDTEYGKGKSQRKRGYFGFAPQKLRCGSADSVTPYAPRETKLGIRN